MKDKLLFTSALHFWLKKKKITQTELARRLGVSSNCISLYKNGDRTPPMEKLEELVAALELTLPAFFSCKDDARPEIEFVERLKARPRAGMGGLETDANHHGQYAFHSSFLIRKGASADDMKIFEVAGESMAPLLSDGDLIMVNTRDCELRSGRVYLLRMGEELMVKRLETLPGGVLLIKSENGDYTDMQITPDESTEITILGRMVWSCREY